LGNKKGICPGKQVAVEKVWLNNKLETVIACGVISTPALQSENLIHAPRGLGLTVLFLKLF